MGAAGSMGAAASAAPWGSPAASWGSPAPAQGASAAVVPAASSGGAAYNGAHSGGVRFGTSRTAALAWGIGSVLAALMCAGIADESSGAGALVRLLALVGFVLLFVAGARLLFIAASRRKLTLEISGEGLTVVKGRDRWQLPWYWVARTRVVEHGSRPWLAVWLAPGVMPPKSLGGGSLRSYHGGIRLFPVAHERRGRRRAREVRELRAALAWHGPQAYDRSP